MEPIKDAFAAAISKAKKRLGRADNQSNPDTHQERGNSVTKLAEEQKNLAIKQDLKELEDALRGDIREMEQRIFIGIGALLKVCPACGRKFKGKGWQGIEAHWRSNHEDILPYEKLWPCLKDWKFPRGYF